MNFLTNQIITVNYVKFLFNIIIYGAKYIILFQFSDFLTQKFDIKMKKIYKIKYIVNNI